MRVTVVTSHPIQYQAPLFQELARRCDLHVLFAHQITPLDLSEAGFKVGFHWDVDLTSGFEHTFLRNVASEPGLGSFGGCDTPDVGEKIRALKPDAVLLTGWRLKSYWQAIWSARQAGIPVMVRGDSHLDTPRNPLKRAAKELIYPIGLRAFDAALYVGERSRKYWEHYHFPKERMFFSPHCIDNEWFAERATIEARESVRDACSISPSAVVALFAGRLLDLKRPHDLIEAAANCRSAGQPVEVMIAGSGELDEALRQAAAERGVPLHMLGFRNQTEMPPVYAAADFLVLPSEHETWGLVANEALACGKPVIVSDACGCALDLAADGLAARIFPKGNTRALAEAINHLIHKPSPPEAFIALKLRYSVGAAVDGVLQAVRAAAMAP